jgi:hypothetical protein
MRPLVRTLAVVALVAAGCGSLDPSTSSVPGTSGPATKSARAATSSNQVAPATSTYGVVPCPEAIEARALSAHSCGLLTVPEDRSRPNGRTIGLLVVRTPTPVSDPRLWTGSGFGGDIGLFSPNVTPEGAERTKADQIQLATRGLDGSDPNLACPEIADLDVVSAEASSHDPAFTTAFVEAVAACRGRLASSGVDVAQYGVDAAAADLEDLRVALRIESWLLDTKGDASLYTFAYLRKWSDHVGQVVMDSPRFPGDGPADDLAATEYAWGRFVASCHLNAACTRQLPDPTATLRSAVARLDAEPLVVPVAEGSLALKAGRPISLVVDGEKLLRVVRSVLGGDGPRFVPGLAAAITEAEQGRLDSSFEALLGGDSTLCLGFQPECPRPGPFSWGAYLTVMCGDVLPFASAAPASPADDPGFARLLADGGPLQIACTAWDVAPADSSVAQVPPAATPILAYTGELDAWSARPVVERRLAALANAHYYELAGQTHNVMGYTACSISMRNAWLDHPVDPPPDTACLNDLSAIVNPSG